ncbi:MAG TPA: carbohydrate kinase family protein [Candidatus Nanoarchaeia archaeon]|nr:carbohydrate kinase family protein [Candidatus Nanoarchaeia archaeon]
MKNYDIITIGSASLDVFVRTKHRYSVIKIKKEEDVCYPIGTKILINELYQEIGGGGTNTATAFSRMGFKTAYFGAVGDDFNGKSIIDSLKKEKIDFLGSAKRGKSGFSTILIGIEHDRTIMTYKGVNDDLRFSRFNQKPKWIYMSSLTGKAFNELFKFASYCRKNSIKYAFNPSAYIAEKGIRKLKGIIQGCNILVLNFEEAQLLLGNLNLNQLLKGLKKYVEIAVITDGRKGAYAYDGRKKYTLIPRKIKVVETTGAGDSFASGFVAGMILKNDIKYALQLGLAEAESVIQYIGAKNKLLSLKEAERIIRKPAKIIEEVCA